MKVDMTKVKKGTSELTPECLRLINEISQCSSSKDLLNFLDKVKVWVYGKCELYHWISILDRFDVILEEAAKNVNGSECILKCDVSFSEEDVRLLLAVLNFTTLLIEHSFSRHLYNSIEHLTELLSSENMDIVLAILNLLYMFSKRSNFIPRLSNSKKDILLRKLFNIAERWGDPNNGLSLSDCCLREPKFDFLNQLYVEYIDEKCQRVVLDIPNMENLCAKYTSSEVVQMLCEGLPNPSEEVKMRIAQRVRLVCGFGNIKLRLQFVQARLQAISVLIYSSALQENVDRILYTGIGEELCELIDRDDHHLVEIRAAVLRTLTSMLHFDRNPNISRSGSRLAKIIYYTGAERQTGVLPRLVKDCISNMTSNMGHNTYPLALATSLFSLLYHLASYESGGKALIKSGMMQSLLQVISWTGVDLEHITFVTRAVRVIDLITNIDIAKFHQNNGINIFIDRLEKEVFICREVITSTLINNQSIDQQGSTELLKDSRNDTLRSSKNVNSNQIACVTQRAALLKSILNFVKKSIQDHAHFNGTRNIMETTLPNSLHHIIFNAEYYGPSLFLLATDVIIVYVFNEPSLLSSLQDSGLTKVILQSLLEKEVPATREVLASLPNVFSALCLNERGLMEFMSYNPFDKLLKVLLSPDYLVAMRKRRSSDPLGDTSTNLGNAMDDLMKHHPYLRTDATEAIVRLLNELVRLGSDINYICWRANKDNNSIYNYNKAQHNCDLTQAHTSRNSNNFISGNEAGDNGNESSDDDDEDDDEISSVSQQQEQMLDSCTSRPAFPKIIEREPIPLIDYILNVMKFIEAIFSNSSNGENCREFVIYGGLKSLLQLLSLPNLPVDSPSSTTAAAVANVAKCILNVFHETRIIDMSLQHLLEIVNELGPLIVNFNFPNCSILFKELLSCPNIDEGFSNAEFTPLLHKLGGVHGYVVMLVNLCRNANNDMRSILLKQWGNKDDIGLQLLQKLVKLYISLVWESTILLNMCSEDSFNQTSSVGLSNLIMSMEAENEASVSANIVNEDLTYNEDNRNILKKVKPENQHRYIKCLLAASSRLGRALAELFGTLVKLSVGSPQSRPRRMHDFITNISSSKQPTREARSIAKVLSSILVNGFCHENLTSKPPPKLKLTFLICSVGFTGPMIFDDKRHAFHLMVSQFYQQNGIKAFFEMFYWALSISNCFYNMSCENNLTIDKILEDCEDDSNEFPEGTGEFLFAWLQLLQKMVNPSGILESPYDISSQVNQDGSKFEPVFYLIQIHNFAIHAIKRIWKREPIANYGVLMTTTIITILKDIVKSHNFLQDQYRARINEMHYKNQSDKKNLDAEFYKEGGVFRGNMKILIDMGFEKSQVLDALRNTSSLEQAMDYLLNRNDDFQAVGNVGIEETSFLSGSSKKDSQGEAMGESESGSTYHGINTCPKKADVFLIPEPFFNKFCDEILENTFKLIEKLPSVISEGSELISILYRRQMSQEKKLFIKKLVHDLKNCSEVVNQQLCKSDTICEDNNVSVKLHTKLKVYTLLIEETYIEFRRDFSKCLLENNCLNTLVSLLIQTEIILTNQSQLNIKKKLPIWLYNLIVFIDAVDSASLVLQRKANVEAITNDIWKWYDIATGKWNNYSEANNTIIQNAFKSGEGTVNINIGRQRYTLNFNCMTQVIEPSSSHTPILPSLKLMDLLSTIKYDKNISPFEGVRTHIISSKSDGSVEHSYDNLILKSIINVNEPIVITEHKEDKRTITDINNVRSYEEKENNVKKKPSAGKGARKKYLNIVLNEELVGLSKFDNNILIGCLIRLLQQNIALQFDTQLAILKFLARLTKNYKNAEFFLKSGGLKLLLKMRQFCAIATYPTYAIIIIRHLLEAPKVLQDTFERVLLTKVSQQVPLSHRDLFFILTQLSPAISRNSNIFLSTAKQALQWDYSVNPKCTTDYSKFIIKAVKSKKNENKDINIEDINSVKTTAKTVKDLLKAVIQPCAHYEDVTQFQNNDGITNDASLRCNSLKKEDLSKNPDKYESSCCIWHLPCSGGRVHTKPVISRSTLLKILVDSVRSYQTIVPRLIISHICYPKDSSLIKHEQSFLSFVLDNFLPIVRSNQISEVSTMTRVLISSLADCYSQLGVQTKVVEEVQDAIKRALILPDSPEKHMRLQVFMGLLPIMIDSPTLSYKNYMFERLMKKGIITSLIKIIQYTDLSNQKTVSTIQSILRPIDILLRIAVSPVTLSGQNMAIIPSSSLIDRRFYSRLNRPHWYSVTEEDETLRNMLRNVFSERRHFDFSLFSSEAASIVNRSHRVVDFYEENNIEFGDDQELDFDRLWSNLIQNEHLRTIDNNITGSNLAEGINQNANDRLQNSDSEIARINNIGCNSDGASTSSENASAILGNQLNLLGECSTSETDSDSNVSTENDDIIDDDDNEEQEENVEERTENDSERQHFIEVFDHVYIPESSETASNDPDIEAEDEESDIGGSNIITAEINSMDTNHCRSFTSHSTDRPVITHPMSLNSNFPLTVGNQCGNTFLNPINNSNSANTIACRINPYLSFVEADERLNFRANGDINVDTVPIMESISCRREGTRRLVFLDQQYCTQMPTFNNPTEEGPIAIFNHDALHWWLEEAKYLDLETHMDACLQVGHLLILHFIKMRESTSKKKSENSKPESLKSSIPIPMQMSNKGMLSSESKKTENDLNISLCQDSSNAFSETGTSNIKVESQEECTLNKDNDELKSESPISEEEMLSCGSNFEMSAQSIPSESANDIQSFENKVEENIAPNTQTSSEISVELTDMNLDDGLTSTNVTQDNISEATTNVATLTTDDTTSEIRAVLGDLQVPEGVDPSFLAALPPEMREEVIQEHIRMQRFGQRTPLIDTSIQYPLSEVNPDFLAALPPNIQTEVLMQQRIEQQRQAAQAANPDDPVDTAAFFQNLSESLRQAILADMEDSQISSLPPDLAAEAQNLRRDWETRNGARLDIPRNPLNRYLSGRLSSSSQNLIEETRWPNTIVWEDSTDMNSSRHPRTTVIHQQQNNGKPLTLLLMENLNSLPDPDSLCTLLLFLFIDDSKFNCNRLHRIIRNLCYHAAIRDWIINALIDIIENVTNKDTTIDSNGKETIQPLWLTLKVDAAFGYKTNTFIINKELNEYTISINPQAAQHIVKNCLDILYSLAKQFGKNFLPCFYDKKQKKKQKLKTKEEAVLSTNPKNNGNGREMKLLDETPSTSKSTQGKSQQLSKCSNKNDMNATSFWKVALNLELTANMRFSQVPSCPLFEHCFWEWKTNNCDFVPFHDSPLSKLLKMLSSKIIRRSPQLTDLLLKLLALLSSDLPDEEKETANRNSTDAKTVKRKNAGPTDDNKTTESNESSKHKMKHGCVLYSKMFSYFIILIEVLTQKCATPEGLENLSKLIFNFCHCSHHMNVVMSHYLRSAILGLAEEVQNEIKCLLNELKVYNTTTQNSCNMDIEKKVTESNVYGVIQDRFTAQTVMISSSNNSRPSCELQLSAIKHLLSASSAQLYFLRTLKIFIQINNLLNAHSNWYSSKQKFCLSEILPLNDLWSTLSKCLISLEESKDEYAVLVLQPTVEAFFLIHASCDTNVPNINEMKNDQPEAVNYSTESECSEGKSTDREEDNLMKDKLQCDRQKFLQFAEKHRTILNQILRQSSIHLSDGPFSVLVDHTRILDFDVKRKFFHTELERNDEGVRREENTVSVRRSSVFEDSFRALYRLTQEEWKNRFYIVFEDEEGQDAGGLLREWYIIISREIFNPMYALFCVSPGDRVTYMINPSSYANPNHLSYFKFVGRLIAKAIHDNKLLECYFTRAFYKHILGKQVKHTDMESQDYEFYKGLDYLMKNDITTLGYELTFSTEVQEFGVTQVRDLIPNGRNIAVNEENKFEYVQLVCQLKMSGSIRQQLDAFLEGFYDIIPKQLISIFNEQELELLISGLPDIDIEDLKANTEYHKYTSKSVQIQWFWRALRSFDQADRAKFLQFVTGTSKVPLQGFGSLEGMNGIQKFQIHRDDRSIERLPCAHTCFNQLDLPMYKSYEKLRTSLLKAIQECSEGFGFA